MVTIWVSTVFIKRASFWYLVSSTELDLCEAFVEWEEIPEFFFEKSFLFETPKETVEYCS